MPYIEVILVLRLALVALAALLCLWVVAGLLKEGEFLWVGVVFFLVGMAALVLLTLTAVKPAWFLPFFLQGLQ